jgi:sRNA-binding protein
MQTLWKTFAAIVTVAALTCTSALAQMSPDEAARRLAAAQAECDVLTVEQVRALRAELAEARKQLAALRAELERIKADAAKPDEPPKAEKPKPVTTWTNQHFAQTFAQPMFAWDLQRPTGVVYGWTPERIEMVTAWAKRNLVGQNIDMRMVTTLRSSGGAHSLASVKVDPLQVMVSNVKMAPVGNDTPVRMVGTITSASWHHNGILSLEVQQAKE